MKILAIETSCDDTCAAVLDDDKILSNVISSQTDLHSKWGGVVPDIAKRAHQERIMPVIETALNRARVKIESIEVIAVTIGPGLAIALGVGVNKAKELALKYKKKLIAVNHIEGHMLVNLAKNKNGNPKREIQFPSLALTVSGGHTKIVLVKRNKSPLHPPLTRGVKSVFDYEVVGETLDDAAGEALDKAAKLLGLGYPGGPVIERLSESNSVNNKSLLNLPKSLQDKNVLDYSFSGLKTSFYYQIKDWPKEKVSKNLANLAATIQEAVFEQLLRKYKLAIEKYKPKSLLCGGGVMANLTLRKRIRKLAKEVNLPIWLPFKKELNTDNAAMIGVAAYYKAKRREFVKEIEKLDRDPRAAL
jgi:N6-L-threonylcarbamoyladenine synthase